MFFKFSLVAKIGFEMAEGSPLVIMEGQTREVCINLFEPQELATFIDLTITTTPQSVSGKSLVLCNVRDTIVP